MKKHSLRIILFLLVAALSILTIDVPALAQGSEPPVIQADTLILTVGETFDPMVGVTVTDDVDQDLVSQVVVNSYVDTSMPGKYVIDYSVMDSDGNPAWLFRIVAVLADSNPVIYASDQKMETGTAFDPLLGVYAFDLEDKDITSKIEVIENHVDTSAEGEYTVVYRVADSGGNITEATILVFVMINEKDRPQITADVAILKVGSIFDPLAGVTAIDPVEGDISSLITVVDNTVDTSIPGWYYVSYEVVNSKGISGYGYRDVIVLSSSVPVIYVYDIEIGLDFTDYAEFIVKSATAYDVEDGNISDQIAIGSTDLNISVAGIYDMTLVVTDSDGNSAEVAIKVTVIDYSFPQIYAWDAQVILGAEFDPLGNVYVSDRQDSDIMDKVIITENTVDTSTIGTYSVTFSVTNSLGKTATRTIQVEVIPEPVIEIYLLYAGESYLLELDNLKDMILFEPPVNIPEGAVVRLAMYVNGELFIETGDFTVGNEMEPDEKYGLTLGEGVVSARLIPALEEGAAHHYNAKNAVIDFTSNADGRYYYAVVATDAEIPAIDTSGEGTACLAGATSFNLSGLSVSEWTCYVVVKDEYGQVSEPLRIDIHRTPNIPNNYNNNAPNNNKDAK